MSARPIKAEDLRWLVCPVCHDSLQLTSNLVCCEGCGRRYPIVDGIAVLLADRAISSASV
jgi:uncharacterized protein YbaR (Trm112 family)